MPLNHYRLLGPSALRVSPLCLGTMTFGKDWGWGADRDESLAQLNAYAEAGGNFIDTANLYTNGSSETLLGEFLRNRRDGFVLASKYTFSMRPGDPNASGNHRKALVQSLEASLRRLATDYLDVYWVHAWDGVTPIEELLRAMDDVVRQGKVLHVGASNFPAWVVSRANALAGLRGGTPFTAIQIEYSLIERSAERELLPMARELGLAVTPWSPLGQGVLTGKYRRDGTAAGEARHQKDTDWGRLYLTDRNLAIAETVVKVAAKVGASAAQVAVAYLLHQPGVTSPIVGARNVKQLKEVLRAADLALPAELLGELDRASGVALGYPHEFLGSANVKQMFTGGTVVGE